ncbi:MAG: Ureidoglycolate hydrolase [Clostridia bacterium]|nr:Ureidoglycolate hydrolase [Clostridia bacterium]
MYNIKLQPLTKEAFSPYGEYYTMDAPDGYSLKGELHAFYPDRMTVYHSGLSAFSPITVNKPDRMIVKQVEYHTTTAEMIMPLNDDMILHVAQPSAGKPIPELTKAFIVPKHTLIKMNTCVWHLAPLPLNESQLTALIILPECTYMNDCTVVDLSEDEMFEIVK